MNDPAWDKIVDAIDAKFGIASHGRSTEPLEDNHELTQSVAYITFDHAGASYKVERIARPAILDRKSHYHRSAGTSVRFENIYDPDSLTHVTKFYRQNGDDWVETPAEDLAL